MCSLCDRLAYVRFRANRRYDVIFPAVHLWRTVLQRCCQIGNPSRRSKSLRVKRYEEDATRTWLRGLQSSYDLDVTVNPPP